MPVTNALSTRGRTKTDIGSGVPLEMFTLVHQAILKHEQIWGYLKGWRIRFCPHALGWRHDDPHVLALMLKDRQERFLDADRREWLLEWQWLRLADLAIPIPRKGEWITRPKESRPAVSEFLTEVYVEAE